VRLPHWEEPLGHAHNIYLNLLAESGLFGLMSFLLFWFGVLIWLWQQRCRATDDQDWTVPFILGIIGVVVHLSIHNFFDNLFVQGNYLHIALWLAAVQAKGYSSHYSKN
jgi:O-antigen ligase